MAIGEDERNGNSTEQQLSELEAMRRDLREMLAKVDEQVEQIRRSAQPTEPRLAQDDESASKKRIWARSAREMVLDALGDLGWPAYTREVATLIEASRGRRIPPTRFGTLVADEVTAFRSKGMASRPVWISFALTADRHEPIKRLLTRSDWPLDLRIHALTTGRLQYLWMTKRFCELAMKADEFAVDPQMLRILAADHARDLPGVSVQRGKFELDHWRKVAAEQIAELGPRDEALRKESADRLARRSGLFQLFGLPEVIEGDRESPTPREREHA